MKVTEAGGFISLERRCRFEVQQSELKKVQYKKSSQIRIATKKY
jgi:hypothetical protein